MQYPRALWALWLIILVGCMVLLVQNPLLMQSLRLAQFDQFQRWHPRPYTPTVVQVVDIDEASLAAYGQWPWSRTRIAELVDMLASYGATAIVFDVLFAEPDQCQNPTTNPTTPDFDAALARSLQKYPVVLGMNVAPTGTSVEIESPHYRVVQLGTTPAEDWLPYFSASVRPLPVLDAAASGVGVLNQSPDLDGVVRRVPVLVRQGNHIIPSLSAEALRVAQGAAVRNYLLKTGEGGVEEVRIGNFGIPTNPHAEMWLHYTKTPSINSVPVYHVLKQIVDPQAIEGKIILIGSSAAGLMDLRPSPLGYSLPGVFFHAMALEQILTNQHLERPFWAETLELLMLAVGGLVVGTVALIKPLRQSVLTLGAVLLALGGGVWFALTSAHCLLDAVNPALAILTVFIVTSRLRYWVVERQQRWLRTAFSRYVSPNRVQYLIEHPEQLHLGGIRQECSFVFTDLAGFTAMLEQYDPSQITALLNEYLESLLAIAFKYDATLDRFVGDAIAVLFSAPVIQPDHRQRALDCAMEMDAFAFAYAKRLQTQGIHWGITRIGVHCGEVLVGNFGSKTLFDYRALGDPINVTSRLESANKYLGTRVCISQAILEGCSAAIPTRTIGRLVLKGKQQSLQVLTPESTIDPLIHCPLEEYQELMGLLQSDGGALGEMVEILEKLSRRYPHDRLIQLHYQRVQQGARDDVIVMAEK
ncbi:MAG: hypothetical protein RIR79_1805 [Pseudomonadota bacterium]|jgi:adenylate cyclase